MESDLSDGQKMQFIARVLAGEDEMTALCREYEVSRKTGYKWLGRYISEGAAGLAERSHAPLQHGQATSSESAHHPELPVPAVSTIGDWLRREGVAGGDLAAEGFLKATGKTRELLSMSVADRREMRMGQEAFWARQLRR
jgi:transposase-like protein